jgi:hypothetical protein
MKIADGRISSEDAKKINQILKKNFPNCDVQVESSGTDRGGEKCMHRSMRSGENRCLQTL